MSDELILLESVHMGPCYCLQHIHLPDSGADGGILRHLTFWERVQIQRRAYILCTLPVLLHTLPTRPYLPATLHTPRPSTVLDASPSPLAILVETYNSLAV